MAQDNILKLTKIDQSSVSACEEWRVPKVEGEGIIIDDVHISPTELKDRETVLKKFFDREKSKGYEEGIKKGITEGKNQIAEQVATFTAIVAALEKELHTVEGNLQDSIIDLVIMIAKAVIKCDLTISKSCIESLVQEGVKIFSEQKEIVKVFVNPNDYNVIDESFKKKSTDDVKKISLCKDDKITQGGCKIESGYTLIDATIETRFKDAIDKICSVMTGKSNDTPDT